MKSAVQTRVGCDRCENARRLHPSQKSSPSQLRPLWELHLNARQLSQTQP